MHIERETRKQRELDGNEQGEDADDADLVNQFKELLAKQKAIDDESEQV